MTSSAPPNPGNGSRTNFAAMRAVTQDRYGTSEVLQLAELPRPTVGDDRVLISVRAAGLDRGTEHLLTGKPYAMRLGAGMRRPKNPIPGRDVAGTVVQVGAKVTRFSAGDEVYGVAPGSFAEYAVTAENKVAVKPSNLSFAQAAVVPISAGTALQALNDAGRLEAGQSVLVTGASGGVGSYAIQLARILGAEVTGVCSTSKIDYVTSAGRPPRPRLHQRPTGPMATAATTSFSTSRATHQSDGFAVPSRPTGRSYSSAASTAAPSPG